MARFAKFLGGALGWAFGGPIGGIIGFALGAYLDEASGNAAKARNTQQGDFTASLLVLIAAVMKADGKVLKSELDFVKQFLLNQMGEEKAKQSLNLLKEILEKDIPVNQVCSQIKQYMDYRSRLLLVQLLFGVAKSDGKIDKKEEDLISQIAGNMGIYTNDYQSVKAMFIEETDSAYKILEVNKDSSDDEIKKAYRRLAIKYHPDKVAHLGAEYQQSAKEKFQKLNQAYEKIKRERGIV